MVFQAQLDHEARQAQLLLTMNLVAANVRRLILLSAPKVRASLRRLLRSRDSTREKSRGDTHPVPLLIGWGEGGPAPAGPGEGTE